MLDALRIAPPQLPAGAIGVLVGVGATLAGLTLVLSGRVLWRLVAMAVTGGLAAGVGWYIGVAYGRFSPMTGALVAGLCFAVVGAVLARLVWAAVLGLSLAAAATVVVIHYVTQGQTNLPTAVPAGVPPKEWLQHAAKALVEWGRWLMENRHVGLAVLAASVSTLVGLVVGLIRPVLTRIAGTSILGAAAAVTGGCWVVGVIVGGLDCSGQPNKWIVLGIGGAIVLVGLIVQYRSELRRQRHQMKDLDAAPPSGGAAALRSAPPAVHKHG